MLIYASPMFPLTGFPSCSVIPFIRFIKKGLIYPKDSFHQLLQRVTRFVFCPNRKIRTQVRSFVNKRGNKSMVGVQLRFGGKLANSHERITFLLPEKIPHIKQIISQQINPNTFVYVCSDSSLVIDEIREYTNNSIWLSSFINDSMLLSERYSTTLSFT